MTGDTDTAPQMTRLPRLQFWGLVVAVFMLLQIPVLRIPVLFMSTWAHELGHGLGALMSGGEFLRLTIYPNFSGVALTATGSNAAHALVVVMGLLGPGLLGALMIILTRAFGRYRFSLLMLAALLALSLLWARDPFTLATLSGAAVIIGLIGWKVPERAVNYTAYIVAIALGLTALTGFGYFFIGNAEVAGGVYRSDTGILADLWGGPHWLWGGLLAALSVAILFVSMVISDRVSRA